VIWIGGMVFNYLVLIPGTSSLNPEQKDAVLSGVSKRFSMISMFCILVLLITGYLQTPSGMFFAPDTHFGEVLMIKHILIIIVILLGIIISMVYVPKIKKYAVKPGETPSAELISARKAMDTLSFITMILGVLIVIVISLR
jgi:putative copper export protein